MNYFKLFLLMLFTALTCRFLFMADYAISDSNVYMMTSKAVSEGTVMYDGFFLAHPPLFILYYSLFSYSLLTFRIATAITTCIIALMIYLILKREVNEETAFIGSILLFTSIDFYSILNKTIGYDLVLALILIGYYYRNKLTGFTALALACLTRLFALPVTISIALISKRKTLLLAPLGVLILALIMPGMFEQVFLYHAIKDPNTNLTKLKMLFHYFFLNIPLISLTLLNLKHFKKDLSYYLIILSSLLLIIIQRNMFVMYFSMILPWLVILAAKYLSRVESWPKRFSLVLAVLFINGFLLGFYFPEEYVSADDLDWFKSQSLPLIGDLVTAPLISYHSGINLVNTSSEPYGMIDTSCHRLLNPDFRSELFERLSSIDYLLSCYDDSRWGSCFCKALNYSDYALVYSFHTTFGEKIGAYERKVLQE